MRRRPIPHAPAAARTAVAGTTAPRIRAFDQYTACTAVSETISNAAARHPAHAFGLSPTDRGVRQTRTAPHAASRNTPTFHPPTAHRTVRGNPAAAGPSGADPTTG